MDQSANRSLALRKFQRCHSTVCKLLFYMYINKITSLSGQLCCCFLLLRDSPESPSELINDGVIVRDSLVVHAPSSSDDFQSSFVYQISYVLPRLLVLPLPPFPQESGFNVNKSASRIVREMEKNVRLIALGKFLALLYTVI